MNENWVIINDRQIRHLWCCPSCGTEEYVSPCYYEKHGTPGCGARFADGEAEVVCDTDMEYYHTEFNNA